LCGQIFGLFKGPFNPKKPGSLPAYIPSQNFVMAFLDIIPAATGLSTGGEVKAKAMAAAAGVGAAVSPPAAPPLGNPTQHDTASHVRAMFDSLWAAAHKSAEDPNTQKVGKPLIAMLDAAGNDATKLKKSIEDWYNSAMDRVSGWYKYRTQWVLFGIGMVLAASMNVDAINIIKQLSKDSTLRQSIVAAADNVKPPDNGSNGTTKEQIDKVKSVVEDVKNFGIPLGWSHVPDILENGRWHAGYLGVLLGWLMTAIAVSLGAPFWFDMLNKIMVVRSTVKPHEKSQDEQSKDN
jgi:hypothetical protein